MHSYMKGSTYTLAVYDESCPLHSSQAYYQSIYDGFMWFYSEVEMEGSATTNDSDNCTNSR